MLQAVLFSGFILLNLTMQDLAEASGCRMEDRVDTRTALILAMKLANIPDRWVGIEARARIYEGDYWVTFFPIPSIPDAIRSVRLDMCGRPLDKNDYVSPKGKS